MTPSAADHPNLKFCVPYPLVAIDDSGSTWAHIPGFQAAIDATRLMMPDAKVILAGRFRIREVTYDTWKKASDRSGTPLDNLKLWLLLAGVEFPAIYYITDGQEPPGVIPEDWRIILVTTRVNKGDT